MIRKTIVAACLFGALCLTGCTPAEVRDVQDAIDSIGEVTLENAEAVDNANDMYEALSDEDKNKVGNRSVLEDANEAISTILYAEIKKELESTTQFESDYFAQYYDMAGISAAKDAAGQAITASDSSAYFDAYTNLKNENDKFRTHLEEKRATSYSVQTGNSEYPFAPDLSEGDHFDFAFSPLVKQDSSYPTYVSFMEALTTDTLPQMHFSFTSNGYAYEYEISQVDTKEIEVQADDGEMKKALVNTELILSDPSSYNGHPWNEGSPIASPCYVFEHPDHGMMIALKDCAGGDFFTLYTFH